jgi:transposase
MGTEVQREDRLQGAAVAVARKLAVIMHAMLRSGEPFNRAISGMA